MGTRAHIDQTSPTGWVLEKEGPVTGVELLHKALPPSTSACTGTKGEGKYLPDRLRMKLDDAQVLQAGLRWVKALGGTWRPGLRSTHAVVAR